MAQIIFPDTNSAAHTAQIIFAGTNSTAQMAQTIPPGKLGNTDGTDHLCRHQLRGTDATYRSSVQTDAADQFLSQIQQAQRRRYHRSSFHAQKIHSTDGTDHPKHHRTGGADHPSDTKSTAQIGAGHLSIRKLTTQMAQKAHIARHSPRGTNCTDHPGANPRHR